MVIFPRKPLLAGRQGRLAGRLVDDNRPPGPQHARHNWVDEPKGQDED